MQKAELAVWKAGEDERLEAWRAEAEIKLKQRSRIVERQAKSMFQRGGDRAEVGARGIIARGIIARGIIAQGHAMPRDGLCGRRSRVSWQCDIGSCLIA